MLRSFDKLYGCADVIFQQELATTHNAKRCFNDHGTTTTDTLTWPKPHLRRIWGGSSRGKEEAEKSTLQRNCRSLAHISALNFLFYCFHLLFKLHKKLIIYKCNFWVVSLNVAWNEKANSVHILFIRIPSTEKWLQYEKRFFFFFSILVSE